MAHPRPHEEGRLQPPDALQGVEPQRKIASGIGVNPMDVLRPAPRPRYGVVAVITRQDEFLVIRRSQSVRAPGALCFPGGGVEPGETEQAALGRELREEIAAEARIIRRLWNNRTPSGVHLAWWRAELLAGSPLRANPAEVESIHWFSAADLRDHPEVLATNRDFLAALERHEFHLD